MLTYVREKEFNGLVDRINNKLRRIFKGLSLNDDTNELVKMLDMN